MWVGMGHVWKYYTEFKCLLSLDLKVSTVEADANVSDTPFQFFIVLLKKLLAYIWYPVYAAHAVPRE